MKFFLFIFIASLVDTGVSSYHIKVYDLLSPLIILYIAFRLTAYRAIFIEFFGLICSFFIIFLIKSLYINQLDFVGWAIFIRIMSLISIAYFTITLIKDLEYEPLNYKINHFSNPHITYAVLGVFSINNVFVNGGRVGYPLTPDGADPHVYAPAIMIVVLTSLAIINKALNFKSNKGLFLKIFILCFLFMVAITTGSRGGLLILFGITSFFAWKRVGLKFKSQVNRRKLTMIFSFFVFLFPLALYLVSTSDFPMWRFFHFIDVLTASDASRSVAIKDNMEMLFSIDNFLLGQADYVIGSDHGITFMYITCGISGVILFLLFMSRMMNFLTDNMSKGVIFSLIIFTSIASETILLPRFHITVFWCIYAIHVYKVFLNKKLASRVSFSSRAQ